MYEILEEGGEGEHVPEKGGRGRTGKDINDDDDDNRP